MRSAVFRAFSLTCAILSPGGVYAQEILVTGVTPKCPECLRPQRTAVLGDRQDSLSLGGFPRVVRVSDQYFAISGLNQPSTILVYSSDGRLQRNIGRSGEGPGEVTGVWTVSRGQADSVLVGEMGGRLHTFAGDGSFGRTLNLQRMATRTIQFPDGDWLVSAQIPTRSGIGVPLNLFSPTGERKGVVGNEQRVLPWRPGSRTRTVALASDSSFWVAGQDHYVIEEWSKAGTLLRTIRRRVDWFPRPREDRPWPNPAVERPDPGVIDFQQDGHLLWVLIVVADEEWAPLEPERPGGPIPATPETNNQLWDTVFEVIDLRDGSLFASTKMRERAGSFSGPGETYTFREGQDGMLYIDVWTLSLEGR